MSEGAIAPVAAGGLGAALSLLEEEIEHLEKRYLSGYFPTKPEDGPDEFQYDVKAFCLLAHAAYEEFVEQVSEHVMKKIETDFLSKKVTLSTACFLMAYGPKLQIAENEGENQDGCFTLIRKAIELAKEKHSATLMDNHGFSLKYLRKILVPVGIDVPSSTEMDSLRKLADARGSFAHTLARKAMYGEYRRANKVLTPEEAQVSAKDCLEICRVIAARSEKVW